MKRSRMKVAAAADPMRRRMAAAAGLPRNHFRLSLRHRQRLLVAAAGAAGLLLPRLPLLLPLLLSSSSFRQVWAAGAWGEGSESLRLLAAQGQPPRAPSRAQRLRRAAGLRPQIPLQRILPRRSLLPAPLCANLITKDRRKHHEN